MRRNLHILSAIALIFAINVGYANTDGVKEKSEGQEQEQEARRKSNQTMMQPDAGMPSDGSSQGVQEDEKSETSDNADMETVTYQPSINVDTVKDESVSKYNFIFYFLYKFKYDAEEAP